MIKFDNAKIASLLNDSMIAMGVFDSYPELMSEFTDYREMIKFHYNVKESMKFLNEYGDEETINIEDYDDIMNDAIVFITGDDQIANLPD